MKRFVWVLCGAPLVLAACSAFERADILKDAADFSGAPSAAVGDVATEIGKDILTSGSPTSILVYVGGLLGVIVTGWFGRKFLQGKYSKVA